MVFTLVPSGSPSLFGNGRSHWYNLSQIRVNRYVHGGDLKSSVGRPTEYPMTEDETRFLTLVCARPRMFYANANSFADVVAFICGIRCSAKRPHGDFGDFPEFVIERLALPPNTAWTDSLIGAYSGLDMYDACENLRQMLLEWGNLSTDAE